jgi:hypothetical protein
MTVKELIEKLQAFNPDAKIVSITVGSRNEWEYTSEPKLSTNSNMFGERVWIL